MPRQFGGYGGMNIQNVMRQAKKMQEELARKNKELEEREVTGVSGGGMVEVVMTGKNSIKSIHIKPEVVDPKDIEMLEDLIVVAIKDAEDKIASLSKEILGGFANLPH